MNNSFNSRSSSPLDGPIRQNRSSSSSSNSETVSRRTTTYSLLSFDSIATSERLLDKLDLSPDEELLLEEALKEEEDRNRKLQSSFRPTSSTGNVICMPASGFPSLRSRNLLSSQRDANAGNLKPFLRGEELVVKDKTLAARVEQHFVPKSRFSYIVEEDNTEDVDDGVSYPNDSNDNELVNFEKYRLDNDQLIHLVSETRNSNELPKNLQQLNLSSNSPIKNNVNRNDSTNSTNTIFSETSQLLKPKTQSTFDSDSSPERLTPNSDSSSPRGKSQQTIILSGPDRILAKEVSSNPPSPSYKTHKKKSSLSSLKNLFKSSKTKHKNDQPSNVNDSPMSTNSTLKLSNASHSSIPSMSSSTGMSKYILTPNPVFHFGENSSTTNAKPPSSVENTPTHYRSLSDLQSPNGNQKHEKLATRTYHPFKERSLPPSTNQRPHARRSMSLDLAHDKQIKLQEQQFPAYQNRKPPIMDSIRSAITMRHEGKLRESAEKLRKACLTGDKTAFLLYGLALRYGCGVPKNYAESFRYIMASTGINNVKLEIFDVNIDHHIK